MLDEINKLRPKLASGDLGDGVKTIPLEPLPLDNIHFKRGPEFSATFNNILVNGPSAFIVNKLRYSTKRRTHYNPILFLSTLDSMQNQFFFLFLFFFSISESIYRI